MIDLRSDTVTRPTPAMLDAMQGAQLGDDVFGEDPSINALQEKAADLFGMEAALFCPSGTMTNQIAIAVHTRPGDEVICHPLAHIYLYEGGGVMATAGASVKLAGTQDGLVSPAEVAAAINPADDPHAARTRLVALENTSNKGGGTCLPFDDIQAIGALAREQDLGFHLDGARLFNALVESEQTPVDYGRVFDSISICLSKGLGCPVGSLLLGSRAFIAQALRVRKRLGGGMRQAGMLAAAGIYALDHHVERLAEDHVKARRLGECLADLDGVEQVKRVATNIVIFRFAAVAEAARFVERMGKQGIRCLHLGHGTVRMVTHLDVSMADIDRACEIIASSRTNRPVSA